MTQRLSIPTIVLLATALACGEDASPAGPQAPVPPGSSDPEILEVSPAEVTTPKVAVIPIRGRNLSSLTSALMVETGSTDPVLQGTTWVLGDTLAAVSLDITLWVPNGIYDVRLSFEGGSVLTAPGVVRIARPVPQFDSLTSTQLFGSRDRLQLQVWGSRLAEVRPIQIPGSQPSFIISSEATDTLVTATYWIMPSTPAGDYDVLAWTPATQATAPWTLELSAAVTIGPQEPPQVDPFQIALTPGQEASHDLLGTGMDTTTTFLFQDNSETTAGVLPVVRVARLAEFNNGANWGFTTIIAAPVDVLSGSYDLIVTTGMLADTVPGALTVPAP